MTLRAVRTAAASCRCSCGRPPRWQPGPRRLAAAAAATGPLSHMSTRISFLWRTLPVFSAAVASPRRCLSSAAAPAAERSDSGPAVAAGAASAPSVSSSPSTSGGRKLPRQPWRLDNIVFELSSIRDMEEPLMFWKHSDRLRNKVFPLMPPDPADRELPPANFEGLKRSLHLTVWHYAFLCYHSVRLGIMDYVARYTREMELRGLPVISLLLELQLHASPSYQPDWKSREVLKRLIQHLDAQSTERPAPGAPLLPADALRRVLFPYDGHCYKTLCKPVHGAEYRMRAAGSMSCYQFLQVEGLLGIKPAMPLYLRLMRVLLDAQRFVDCRQVYGDLVDKGLEETAEGYALLMESLVEEGWQLPNSSQAAAGTASPVPEQQQQQQQQAESPQPAAAEAASASSTAVAGLDMTLRKRQLVKLKVLTLMQEMRRRKLQLTLAHYAHIIRACCLVQDSKYALLFYSMMQQQQLVPPISTYHALLSLHALSPADVAAMLRSMQRTTGWDLETFRCATANAARHRDFSAVVFAFNRIQTQHWVGSPVTGRGKEGAGMIGILKAVGRLIRSAALEAGDDGTVRWLDAANRERSVFLSSEQFRNGSEGRTEPRPHKITQRQGRVAR